MKRWWIYQRERFPLAAHGPLILAFSFCAVAYSANLRGGAWPAWPAAAVAFATCLLFFLQLRIADEFKDAEEDARFRPYRPVPRGLVRLRELGWVFAGGAALQLALALGYHAPLVLVLFGAWAYLAAMSREFGVRDWLKARPITYLWSHMLIMPIVDFYATSCDWMPAQGRPPGGLLCFLAASFCNGVVIELGRKIRAPQDEEEGVPTYSRLWGPTRAALVWLAMIIATAGWAVAAAVPIAAVPPVAAVLGAGVLGALVLALRFRAAPDDGGRANWIERWSGVWTLLLYLALGVLPGLVRAWG